MNYQDYPSLYQATDFASKKAQKLHLYLFAFILVFMIMSAIVGGYIFSSTDTKQIVYIISGVFLLLSIGLSILSKFMKWEDVWYKGRTVAESVKTLTWRYVICSEGFEITKPQVQVDNSFSIKLKEISSEFRELSSSLNIDVLLKPEISDKMRSIRIMNNTERKSIYVQYRITQQKHWYLAKANYHKKCYRALFVIIIISQILALLSVGYLMKFPDSKYHLSGIFSIIAASAIGWLQLNKHQYLIQAYTIAAQELGFIELNSVNIDTEEQLSNFVLDSENAISREHTLWIAQRRK